MKKTACLILAMLMLGICLTGCSEIKPNNAEINLNNMRWASDLNAAVVEKVSVSMSDVSFDEKLLTYISENTEGNYMVSPLSFRYALGLLLAGAEGETKAELLNALSVKSAQEWTEYCNNFNGFTRLFDEQLKEEIEAFHHDKQCGYVDDDAEAPFRALRVANSVWKCEDIAEEFNAEYRDFISKNYAAEYSTFTQENAVKLINEWASIKTEKMIPELLPEDYPTQDLAVVLMNALYFKDTWVNSFSKALTKDDTFTTEKGEKVTKTFMTQTKEFLYYADSSTELVILPMSGNISMAFVIGNTDNISEKTSKATSHSVKVTIPKLDLESSFSNQELCDFLKASGVNKIFDLDADFSAMIDYPIYVDDIIQKTRIKLDEDGVEAAAVTAVMSERTAMIDPEKSLEFTADRPFSFYIYTTCNETTAMLFAGEIVE